MSILDSIITTKPTAPRITIYGKPGIGKSTLASKFPDPLFLLTEQNKVPGIQSLPLITSFESMREIIKELLAIEKLPFKTVVLDSISKLDALVIDHILEKEPPNKSGNKTLASACGGYGAGYQKAALLHMSLKNLLDKFEDKGIGIVYIAHLTHTTIKPPDNEDYTAWTIVMNHDKSREPYINDVDAVLLCKQQEMLISSESGRSLIKSFDDHIIITGMDGVHCSKNRYNMPCQIKMSFDEVKKYISFYNQEEE